MRDERFVQSRAMKAITLALLLANAVGVYAIHVKTDGPVRMALSEDDVLQPFRTHNHYDDLFPSLADASTQPTLNAPEPELPSLAAREDVKTNDGMPSVSDENVAAKVPAVAEAPETSSDRILPSPLKMAEAKPAHVAAAKPAQVAAVKPAHVAAARPAHVAAVKPAHVAAVKPAHVAAVKPAHVAAVKPAHVAAPRPAQVAAVKPAHVAAVKPAHVAAPRPAQVAAVKPAHVATVKPAHVAAARPAHVAAVRPAQIAVVKPVKFAAVRPAVRAKHVVAPVAAAEMKTTHRAAELSSQVSDPVTVGKTPLANGVAPNADITPRADLVIQNQEIVIPSSDLAAQDFIIPDLDVGQAPPSQSSTVAMPEQAGGLPAVSDSSHTTDVVATGAPVTPDAASVGSENNTATNISAGLKS